MIGKRVRITETGCWEIAGLVERREVGTVVWVHAGCAGIKGFETVRGVWGVPLEALEVVE